MPERAKCPMCADGVITRSEGRLDQCGNTHLPTTAWTCDICGYVRYDPALEAQWRADEAVAGAAPPGVRRAA